MRPILHGDVIAAARAVMRLPDALQPRALHLMLARAEAADAFRKRTGRAHPEWGNGSVYAAALPPGAAAPEPESMNLRYLAALGRVTEAIIDWRTRTARR